MAEETHPEISRVVFSDLSRFMTETDGKIQLLLAEFVAEDNEMTWVVKALECYQESLKKKVRDVRSVVFDSDSEGEAYDAIAAALARSFLKDEEVIVARLGLCRKLLGGVPMLRREDSGQTSDAPDEHEEAQELDGVDPESGVEGGPVEEARHEEPKEDSKPPSDSNQSSDVLEKREEGEDLDVIDAQRSNEESKPVTVSEEGLIDARLSSCSQNTAEVQNENAQEDRKLSSNSDGSSEVLQPLTPTIVSPSPTDKENTEAVIPESETIDAVRVTALLDNAETEEPNDDGKVLGANCTVDTGRLEEKKSSVAIEDKLEPRKDRVSADHFLGPKFPGESIEAMEEELTDTQDKIEEIQMTLQTGVADGLKGQAVEVQIKLAVLLTELFLLLSTNNKKMADKEFQAFVSCLEDIDRDKSDTNVVKPIIQVLKIAEKEFSKVEKSSHAQEEDDENQLPEVQELLRNSMILIARLDALMNCMGQFESRLLTEKAIGGFKKGMKDMQAQLLGMESALELLGSRFSYGDFATFITGTRSGSVSRSR